MADARSRGGARYASESILEYVERVHVPQDGAMRAAFGAPARHDVPAIQLGVSEARFIELLIRACTPRKVVEVGTLVGFSALFVARALEEGAALWTLERESRHAALAREHFAQAEYATRISLVEGPAERGLAMLEREAPFDVVFLDADKVSYPQYARWSAAHLRRGGLLLADNAYYFGDLLDPTDTGAAAMRDFHEFVAREFDSVCVPTPDGLVLGLKK